MRSSSTLATLAIGVGLALAPHAAHAGASCVTIAKARLGVTRGGVNVNALGFVNFKGTVTFPVPFDPPFDPVATGARIQIVDGTNALVIDDPAFFSLRGSVKSPKWQYFQYAQTYPGVTLTTKLSRPGEVKIRLKRYLSLGAGSYTLPLAFRLVMSDTLEPGAQCAEALFPGPPPAPSCGGDPAENNVRCR